MVGLNIHSAYEKKLGELEVSWDSDLRSSFQRKRRRMMLSAALVTAALLERFIFDQYAAAGIVAACALSENSQSPKNLIAGAEIV